LILNPYYYQQEILDKLKAEREAHRSFKNLVVAPRGRVRQSSRPLITWTFAG